MELPDKNTRVNTIANDTTVERLLTMYFGEDTAKRLTFLQAIVEADPLTHYVRGLDEWTDYVQRKSKHYPINERTDGWRVR